MHQDEYLDLVDEQDRVIGKKLRSEVYAENLRNYRVINAFLVNAQGKLWIPRRTAHKRLFPLCLDTSVGGHVESGETYEQSFARETSEELNIDVEKVVWKEIGHLTPKEHDVAAFMKVYVIETDDAPTYNSDDFVSYEWLTPQEVLKKVAAGESVKPDLPKVIRALLLQKE